jgi:hypothetical protein
MTAKRRWAYHVDLWSPLRRRAANRAIEAAFVGNRTVPFHELVRQEQRVEAWGVVRAVIACSEREVAG